MFMNRTRAVSLTPVSPLFRVHELVFWSLGPHWGKFKKGEHKSYDDKFVSPPPTGLKGKFPVTYIFLLTADHPPACSTAEERLDQPQASFLTLMAYTSSIVSWADDSSFNRKLLSKKQPGHSCLEFSLLIAMHWTSGVSNSFLFKETGKEILCCSNDRFLSLSPWSLC